MRVSDETHLVLPMQLFVIRANGIGLRHPDNEKSV